MNWGGGGGEEAGEKPGWLMLSPGEPEAMLAGERLAG